MQIRHPVLLVILVIIGIGMINSLIQDPPQPVDQQQVLKEAAETRAFNEAHCKKSDLIYVEQVSGRKGECATSSQLSKMVMEGANKEKERMQENATRGLK